MDVARIRVVPWIGFIKPFHPFRIAEAIIFGWKGFLCCLLVCFLQSMIHTESERIEMKFGGRFHDTKSCSSCKKRWEGKA